MTQQPQEYLDFVSLMVENFKNEKPLLDRAMLFRGSRFGDYGNSSTKELNAHLLPHIAAGYTHSWGRNDGFIETYPIDRETTRFFARDSHEKHLQGHPLQSYSVKDIERVLTPMVENIAYQKEGHGRDRQVEDLEKFIKASFYEAGVPVRNGMSDSAEKFYYTGSPDAQTSKEAFSYMERITPINESRAKQFYAQARPSTAIKAVAKLEFQYGEASNAFKVLQGAAQKDHAQGLLDKLGHKPLMEFISDARGEGPSDAQSRVLRLAQGLAQSLDSRDPETRNRALAVAQGIGKLNPETTTIKDVAMEVAKMTKTASRDLGSGQAQSRTTKPQEMTMAN